MSIQTKKGTNRHSTIGVATIIVSKIKNPPHEESFGSFKISIFDQYKKLIADVSQGITFDTTPGTVRDVMLAP